MEMSLEEVRKTLEPNKLGSTIFRPTRYYTFVELQGKLVLSAFDDLVKKVPLVVAGIDEYSPCEKLMMVLFVEHAKTILGVE